MAIAHKSVQRIWDIKGKRLCHPGFNTVDDWSTVFSTVSEPFFLRKHMLKLLYLPDRIIDPSYISVSRELDNSQRMQFQHDAIREQSARFIQLLRNGLHRRPVVVGRDI